MLIQELKKIVKHHRRAVIVGTVLGLVLIIGFVTYETAMTPTMPIVQKASAAEVVKYISNDRGFAKLPQIQQKQFLDEWGKHVAGGPAKEEMQTCLKNLSEEQRKDFRNAVARQLKRAFLDDAKRFGQLTTPHDKNDFCRKKLTEARDQAAQFKDIALAFKTTSSTRTDDLQQWVMENTTAEERAIGEPFLDALKRVREQVKKEERTTASTAGGKS